MLAQITIVLIAVSFLTACAGDTKQLHMRDTGANTKTEAVDSKTVASPQTETGSKEQASSLAQTFVEHHNKAMQEMAELKRIGNKSLENEEAIKKAISETALKSLQTIEQLSKSHGTGEITIFFPLKSSKVNEKSLEYERLIRFTDFLNRESKGRKILLVSIGSASATGSKKVNQRLAKERSEAAVDIIDKYLVNAPHEFFKAYGTGDLYSPKNLAKKKHEKYQHARLIAFYETDQIPALPDEPAKK